MMRAVSVHIERCSNIYRGLYALATDSSADPESRRLAYNDMFKLSQSVIETYTNAPFAAWNVKRKLQALKKGDNTTPPQAGAGYYHLPPAIPDKYYYNTPPQTPEQQQQQQ